MIFYNESKCSYEMFHPQVHVIVGGVRPKFDLIVTLNVYYFFVHFGSTNRLRFLASSVKRLLRMRKLQSTSHKDVHFLSERNKYPTFACNIPRSGRSRVIN